MAPVTPGSFVTGHADDTPTIHSIREMVDEKACHATRSRLEMDHSIASVIEGSKN